MLKWQKDITREQLSEAGSHLGHQTKRWKPQNEKPYILWGKKNKSHIIDLQQNTMKN
jgi:ribosomal protein S2